MELTTTTTTPTTTPTTYGFPCSAFLLSQLAHSPLPLSGSFSELKEDGELPVIISKKKKEVNKMDSKKEFVEEFREFNDELREAGIEATVEQAVNLFAIFRKDLRTETLNNKRNSETVSEESSELATHKQKRFLKKLSDERGIDISEDEIDSMTKEDASKRITDLLG